MKNSGTGFQPVRRFRCYRRNLPHWESPGHLYYVTFRVTKGFVLPERARELVLKACLFHAGKKYDLIACLVMPDHVHLLFQSLEKSKGEYFSLAEILHSVKSYSANRINQALKREGTVWLGESFDRIVRDDKEFQEKLNYIVNNPLKAGLSGKVEEYRWLYVKGWLNTEWGSAYNLESD